MLEERHEQLKAEFSSDSRYLERLEFDPELRKSWLNFFVTRTRVVLLLIAAVSAWGVYSYTHLPRESNPEVKIPVAVVTTAFPGASPSDVEELVTKKIEKEIATLKDVKKIVSNSANSFSSVSVEFEADADLENSIRSVRDRVSTVVNDLPDDAEEPAVSEVSFDDQPILTFALTGPYDGLVLREYAERLEDELERIPGVREINLSGGDTREFSVEYDPGRLAALGLSPAIVNQSIAATNQAIPGGNFEGREFSYPVRSDARFFDERALGNVPIFHTEQGAVVYVRDVATVRETAVKRTVYSRLSIEGSMSQSSITIDLVKKTGGSILETVATAKGSMAELVPTFPSGMSFVVTEDFSEQIEEDFHQLGTDFVLTVILVMATLLLIVGFKEAIIAGLAIPLVFSITFGVMYMTGTSLNFLSVFSLLLALGLLVDDAIVVVSATKQYMRTGKYTPEEAILLVLRDFKVVLMTTTLATTWAFLPLLLSTGMIGSFIKSIPITVSVILIASLLVALIINHPLAAVLERIRLSRRLWWMLIVVSAVSGAWMLTQNSFGWAVVAVPFLAFSAWATWWFYRDGGRATLRANELLMDMEWHDDELIKKKLREQGTLHDATLWQKFLHGIIRFDRIIPVYEKYLRMTLLTARRRWATIIATVVLFAGSVALPVVGIVKTEFFPPSDEDLLFVNITAPVGLNLAKTDAITQEVESRLRQYPEISNFSTVVGRPGFSPNDSIESSVGGNNSHRAGITVKLVKPKERETTSYALATAMQADMASIQGADIKVESLAGGPPSGAAFEARIKGDDLEKLDRIAQDFRSILGGIPGVSNPDISLKPAPADYTFTLDPSRLELYDLDATSVGSALRMAIAGTEVTTVLRDNQEIKVVARFGAKTIPTLESLEALQLVNRAGRPVALRDIAVVRLEPSIGSITRIDQKRTVLLSSGISGDARSNEVLAEFQEKIEDYPMLEGYSIDYGGENEQNQESVESILRAMIIAGLLIVATMIIQFNSLRQSFIVLVTLPLALIGVFVGLGIFGVPLSFPGLIGILALFGIVVKNAIILIDKINLNIRSGIGFDEAIVDAGKSRIEAIFITSICTIFGIVPITLSNELWRALGSAVIFGLSLSSFLTLFIVPVLFATLMRHRKLP